MHAKELSERKDIVVGCFCDSTPVPDTLPACELQAGPLVGLRESKGNYGYLGQDDPVLHFGLGPNQLVDVVVDFLDGSQFRLNGVAANQQIKIAP